MTLNEVQTDIVVSELEYIRNRILMYKEVLNHTQQVQLIDLLRDEVSNKESEGYDEGRESGLNEAQSNLNDKSTRIVKELVSDFEYEGMFTDAQIEFIKTSLTSKFEEIDITY
jgi:hypothetical protein